MKDEGARPLLCDEMDPDRERRERRLLVVEGGAEEEEVMEAPESEWECEW